MYQNEKNKFQRRFIRCPKCNGPIAEVIGNMIYVGRYIKGEPKKTRIKFRYDTGGRFEINCENCDAEYTFASTRKSLGLTLFYFSYPHLYLDPEYIVGYNESNELFNNKAPKRPSEYYLRIYKRYWLPAHL